MTDLHIPVHTAIPAPLPLASVAIDDPFWSPRIEVVREKTIPFEYHQFDTLGHLRALKHQPAEKDPRPHIFWESDVAKWIEAASFSLATHPDPELDARLDGVIDLLAGAQLPDGYLNTFFTVVEPENRFTDLRDAHELYCAGHLIEAAVAHFEATGKRTLLAVMVRYADYIGTVFGRGPGQIRGYDGHEEIELALVKLARVTGEQRYLDLASFFIEERGQEPYFFDLEAAKRGTPGWFASHFPGNDHPGRTREYLQAHAPVREQPEAVGHSVRAMYLYAAMADLAREQEDDSLLEACRRLWRHLTTRRMYVTGGIGSSADNEGFTTDFDLPEERAYAETCAAIGLVMWAERMLRVDRDRTYGDIMELALYNGVLAGLSHDGTTFFYDNPLASRGGIERHEWFDVACCPPNLARLLSSLGSYAFHVTPVELTVHLFISGTLRIPMGDEIDAREAVVKLTSNYPWDGTVTMAVEQAPSVPFALSFRVPAWSREPVVRVVGSAGSVTDVSTEIGADGYVSVLRQWTDGDTLTFELDVSARRMWADPQLDSSTQRVVIARGPLVYAIEEADNGSGLSELRLPRDAELSEIRLDALPDVVGVRATGVRMEHPGEGLYRSEAPVAHPAEVTMVPYFSWANRGPGEMLVWQREDQG